MTGGNQQFEIKAYSKSQLFAHYGVTAQTFRKWLRPILTEIGTYTGKMYTPAQVKKIVDHLGPPKTAI